MKPRKAPTLPALVSLTAMLCAGAPQAHADPGAGSDWLCQFCTYASGWYGSVGIGSGILRDDDIRYTGYRGLEDAGAYLALDGDAHWRGERETWLDLYASDLGTGSRKLELRGGRRGAYTLELDYSEVSRYRGFGAQSPFLGAGGNTLTLAAGWVPAADTGGFSGLASALQGVSLTTERRTLSAALDLRLAGAWRYEASVRHMDKQGSRPFGAGVFTIQSIHFPVPVDFSENAVGMALHYSGSRSTARFSLDRSWFNNAHPFVVLQNPFEPVGNTQNLRASLEPDSDAWRLGFAGTFKPSPGLRMSLSASLGEHRQDDAFLPYSINPDFDHLELPRSSLGDRLDLQSLNVSARLHARLGRNLDLRLNFKTDERDNRTPVDVFTPVITDLVQRPGTPNRPYSFDRRQYSAAMDFRAGRSARLEAGAKRVERKRSLQSVRSTEDDTLWAGINLHAWASAQFRLQAEHSEQDTTPYETVNDPGLQENPLTRKFNLAGRDRSRVSLSLDLAPGSRFSASLGWSRARDDYEASALGLMESEDDSFNADLGYALGEGTSLYAFASVDYYDSAIAGAVSTGATAWQATTEDRFQTFGAGVSSRISERLQWGADLAVSRARGRIRTDSGAGEAPFPELRNTLRHARLYLDHRGTGPWGWTLAVERETFDSSDWQIDAVAPDSLAAVLSLGVSSPEVHALLVRVQGRYRF